MWNYIEEYRGNKRNINLLVGSVVPRYGSILSIFNIHPHDFVFGTIPKELIPMEIVHCSPLYTQDYSFI